MTNKAMPVAAKEEHFDYLDYLRQSGETNMFGARPYLMSKFPSLSKDDAGAILSFWIMTFPREKAK